MLSDTHDSDIVVTLVAARTHLRQTSGSHKASVHSPVPRKIFRPRNTALVVFPPLYRKPPLCHNECDNCLDREEAGSRWRTESERDLGRQVD